MGPRRRRFFLYLRSLREVQPWWGHLGLIFGLGLLAAPITLLIPVPLKIVIDHVFGQAPLPPLLALVTPDRLAASSDGMLVAALAMAVLVAVLSVLHGTADWLVRESVAERIVRQFQGRIFQHSLALSHLFHDERGTADQAWRIGNDAPALQWTAIYGVMPILIALGTIVSVMSVTALIHAELALIIFATSVPLLLLIHHNQRRMCDQWHRVRELDSDTNAVVVEALGAHRVVVTCGQEQRELSRFVERARQGFGVRIRVMFAESLYGVLLNLSTAVGTSLILYLAVRDVQAGTLTVGELTLILSYAAQLYGPLQTIGSHLSSQQSAIASVERAFDLLDQPPSVAEKPDALPLVRARGEVAFRDVAFAYADGRPVFSEVSFEVPAGSTVGVVGKTGSGKTTLVNLLLRLIDPKQGEVLLDGLPLRSYRLADLRRQFSVVVQEPTLFSTTVADNIAYARPEASAAEIEAAARAAGAHDFIAAMPDGYRTRVGERGMRLSGGERQRLSLARAFLKAAPVLILDEPTSAVDLQTEAEIMDHMQPLMAGRTTFMITHRPSTLAQADLILRVEAGHVSLHDQSELAPLMAGQDERRAVQNWYS